MEEACNELDEVRTELEKLKVEHKAKCHQSETLRRALDEHLNKLQKARADCEQQEKEIDAKSIEIEVEKQKFENLLSKFKEKETALKHLSSASVTTRIRLKEKIKELEELNRDLVSSLDEATIKAERQENIACKYRKEIEAMEGILSESKKKYCDAELRAQPPKEVRRRDEMLDELVWQKGEIEDRLKWKNEQFRHLEEALHKVQGEFRLSKEEWASERSKLLTDISSLQSNVDSLTQVSKDLRSQLQMCNQALVSEENQRRLLEIQLSDSKKRHENIVLEYDEIKSNIVALNARRVGEIASLRNSMYEKNMLIKELELTNRQLEQENQEFVEQCKGSQEASINGIDASNTLKSLRQKFRELHLSHKSCSDKLKAREVDWNQQIRRVSEDLNGCLFKLNSKDQEISALEEELEYVHCLLLQVRMEKEEIYVNNLILDSKLTEICSDLKGYNIEAVWPNGIAEERIAYLTEQLENKSIALTQALKDVFEERQKVDFLLSKTDKFESIIKENILMKEELASSNVMIAKLLKNIDIVKEESAQKELDLQEDLRRASYGFEDVVFELQQQRNVLMQLNKIKCNLEFDLKKTHNESKELKRSMDDRNLEKVEMDKILDFFFKILEEKESRAIDLGIQSLILDERFASINLENSAVHESRKLNDELDKLKTAQILDKHELELKNLLIAELEEDIVSLQVKLESEEKLPSNYASCVQKLQAREFHLENELNSICNWQKSLEEKKEAESQEQTSQESIDKLSEQRELLIKDLMGLGDLIMKVCSIGEVVRKHWDRLA